MSRKGLPNCPTCRLLAEQVCSQHGTVADMIRDAVRYRWLAADGDRAKRILRIYSGHEVQDAIDTHLLAEGLVTGTFAEPSR